jgi:hypothetical protein
MTGAPLLLLPPVRRRVMVQKQEMTKVVQNPLPLLQLLPLFRCPDLNDPTTRSLVGSIICAMEAAAKQVFRLPFSTPNNCKVQNERSRMSSFSK